ncbi:MAG: VanZ family protein [Candidatus Omnitrophota bacterium]
MFDFLSQKKPVFIWMPVVLWASIIFILSVIPTAACLVTKITFLDKISHFAAYAILAVFVVRAFSFARRFSLKKVYLFTLILGGGYGTLIELTQYFIPYRDASIADGASNVFGLILGCYLTRLERLSWQK